MKSIAVILLATLLLPVMSFADDFSLSDGREYKDVTVSRIEPDGVVVITDDGVEKLPFSLMTKEEKALYPYVPPPTPRPQPAAAPASAVQSGTDASKVAPQSSPAPATKEARAPAAASRAAAAESAAWQNGIHAHHYLEILAMGGLLLLVALATAGCGWFIARRLLEAAMSRQKEREFDFANARQFHSAYADFFAIMRLWNHCLEHNEDELPSAGEYELPHATRWELLARAYTAESAVESIFLKLASAWNLTPVEIELMGRFRQAFRTLGESIRNNKALKWNDPEAGEYLIFNRLAAGVALLVGGENVAEKMSEQRAGTFRQITSNHWGRVWNSTEPKPGTEIPR